MIKPVAIKKTRFIIKNELLKSNSFHEGCNLLTDVAMLTRRLPHPQRIQFLRIEHNNIVNKTKVMNHCFGEIYIWAGFCKPEQQQRACVFVGMPVCACMGACAHVHMCACVCVCARVCTCAFFTRLYLNILWDEVNEVLK